MRAALLLTLLLPLHPALLHPAILHPAIVGTSRPAESITAARIATLPPSERPAWLLYLRHSQGQLMFDQDEPFVERNHLAGPIPPPPRESNSARSIPLDRDPAFYASPEAHRIAQTILSFQLPNGGWSKNLDMTQPPRLPGQSFLPNNLSRFLGPDDFDTPANPAWNYAGTLDNDATTTEIRFLARVASATRGSASEPLRAAVLRGLYYLLNAQFPNGGWPQVWPLEGGYHDAITFNDNAVTQAAEVLTAASTGAGDYAFVPPDLRALAAASAARALNCILKTQVVIDGHPTVWAQQHDALTLAPVAGRNFEPAALSAGESADLLLYLMQLPSPSPAVRASVESGVAWLRVHAIHGQQFTGGRSDPEGRHLAPAPPGAPPIWPRYTSLTTGQPIFGDRDKTIHDTVADLTLERRNGYAWFSSSPQRALDAYARWKLAH